jgi:hypothetical protein
LKQPRIIKSIVSIFLLGVFALGITPKQVLHDILTNHEHIPEKTKTGACITKDRFNCDDENFVAQSPFVGQDCILVIDIPPIFQVKLKCFFTSYTFLHQFFFELRGPPSLA